ncbi:ABC transporter permease [Arthrobacter sp. 35W]|uniref:ABC transporter permease n=1 Tax=Arthrobacter sp. 35W TaxID=1132441 RepID=UPI0004128962|nr:ABC transporter permease [Arthrobacter sp. 35W]
MLTVALGQLKTHSRRFIAIALAVILAVAFLTATLTVNASAQASLRASIGQSFGTADLVVSPTDGSPLDRRAADAVAGAAGVQGTYAQELAYVQAGTGSAVVSGLVRNMPASDALQSDKLESGAWPTAAGQIAVDSATAARNKLAVGSTISLRAAGAPGAGQTPAVSAVVSGLLAATSDPMMSSQSQFLAPADMVAQLAGGPAAFNRITVDLAHGTDVAAAKTAITTALAAAGTTTASVLTADERTKELVSSFTGGSDHLTIVLLAFAAIALLVSALVVSNTFSVLVAQRTRELALLRCVGADRRQIHRSVLLEALVVGTVASIAGVALAAGGMSILIAVLAQNPAYGFATLAVPPAAVLTGLLVGIALTVLAALAPARAATAVAPLAALRPADDASLKNSRGQVRLVCGVVLMLLGTVGLVVGGLTSQLLVALPSGAASFVGFLMAASLFIPRVVAAAGKLASPAGVPGRLAAVNAVRNPGRTTATASALLIGVTLVTMMMTGAATARTAFDSSLDGRYPVDVAVTANPGPDGAAGFTPAQLDAVRALGGVRAVGQLSVVGSVEQSGYPQTVYGISDADAAALLVNAGNRPTHGTLLMPKGTKATSLGVSAGSATTTLPVATATSGEFPALVSLDTLPALAPGSTSSEVADAPTLWVGLNPDISQGDLLGLRQQISSALGVNEYQVQGGAIEKATFNQVIDVLLMVVTGLLAIAVLIALIGVANTLSLSVLERTRENSLLRALGLTRGQLRGMLALEAVLIAAVAAILGSVLGVVYGWVGAQSALGSFAAVTATIPWAQIGLVVGVAAVAGLLASVVPAHRAARLSPVAGLAAE